jgi:hypothetical protein
VDEKTIDGQRAGKIKSFKCSNVCIEEFSKLCKKYRQLGEI